VEPPLENASLKAFGDKRSCKMDMRFPSAYISADSLQISLFCFPCATTSPLSLLLFVTYYHYKLIDIGKPRTRHIHRIGKDERASVPIQCQIGWLEALISPS